MKKIYDVIIIGAGPAGLAAALYAGRARLDTLIIEKTTEGGQIAITSEVENYPGSIEGETGPSLVKRMANQAKAFGAQRIYDTIENVELKEKIKIAHGQKASYKARTIIIATGANPKLVGCPGEKELTGKGVSYCATCDASFFEDLEVYVVGGGDTAVEESIYLSKFARKVTIIHRRNKLRACKYIQEKAFAKPNIEFLWNKNIKELKGDGTLDAIVLEDTVNGEISEIHADEEDGVFGLFVFIGFIPNSKMFKGILDMDDDYIITDEKMQTNISGVFAVGDVRKSPLKQVITAASDGAIAAIMVEKYLENSDLEGEKTMIVELNKDNFEAEVMETEGKVFVDFYGDNCAPCEALMPFIKECANKYGEKIKFVALNTNKARRVAIKQKVLGLPVIAIYEKGEKVEELVKEEATEENIENMIGRHL